MALRDINPGPPSPPRRLVNDIRLLRAVGSGAFYARATRNEAWELWRSDGTAAGTALVADVSPGEGSGMVDGELLGNRMFFAGFDAALEGVRVLYVSDGTAAGTSLVSSFVAGYPANPSHFRAVGGVMMFVADTPDAGRELWRSDGTASGTVRVSDIYPGSIGSDPRPMLVSNGVVYFLASHPLYGREIWRSDGTAPGTRLLGETIAGLGNAFEYDQMVEIGGVIYFGADVAPAGYELWRSDGTQAGTRLLKDVNPGVGASYPSHFAPYQGGLLFSAFEPVAGRELWWSDGTTAGTRLWLDLQPGSASSNPGLFTPLGARLLLAADGNGLGNELWETDGTVAGTRLVRDIAVGAASSRLRDLVPLAGGFVFVADDGVNGEEPWFTDGTPAGTRLLADVAPGSEASFPSKPVVGSGPVYFTAFDPVAGRELWRTDEVTATRVADSELEDVGSYPRVVLALGDETYYAARSDGRTEALWRTDGTANGTARVPAAVGASFAGLVASPTQDFFAAEFADSVYFVAAGSVGAAAYTHALWRYERLARVTTFVFGQTASGSLVPSIGAVGGAAFGIVFAIVDASDGRRKLMAYSPAQGVRVLRDFGAGSLFDAVPGDASFTRVGAHVYFHGHTAAAGGELWRTDGTAAGTVQVTDLAPGSASAEPRFLAAFGDTVLFGCRALPGLFRSDGTEPGTARLTTVRVQSALAVGGTGAVFFGDDGVAGAEPWHTDGTAAGTLQLADLAAGAGGSGGAGAPVFAFDTWFFVARTPATGFELWRTDGTGPGTSLVRDVHPGSASGALWTATQERYPPAPAGSGRLVVFAGADLGSGVELWRSDGTTAGTQRLFDQRPGPASSTPRAFARAGRRLLWSADDGARGHELFALDLAQIAGVLAEPYGRGCAGTNGLSPDLAARTLPRVGTTFSLAVQRGRAGAPFALLLGVARASVFLGGGCDLLVLDPTVPLAGNLDGAGAGVIGLPIPAVPQLAGVELFVQAAVADPAGAYLGVAAFSNGVHVLIGR